MALSVEQIEDRITNMEQANAPLFERMDTDWDLYNLVPFKPMPGEGIRQEDAFTSNRPKIVADKLIGAIAGAKQITRVVVDAENEEEREINNNFERLGIGFLGLADKRKVGAGGVPIRTELANRAIIFGGYAAARALLLKDENGDTEVSVDVIHPRQLLIQQGATGPIWAAIVTMRNRANIRSEYPKYKFEDEDDKEEDAQRTEKVIDYYWREKGKFMNAVVVAGRFAKKATDTNAKTFPIIARAIGSHSGTSGINSLRDNSGSTQTPGIATFGESIFAPLRTNNAFKNRLMSYRMSMAARSVRQITIIESSGGTRELEGDVDEDTTEINLDVDNQERIYPMEVRELTRDVDALSGFVNVEDADGSLPEQAFGRLPAPISGNTLRILGSSVGERLEPFIRPIESCIEGIIEALVLQYESGNYKEVKVSGRSRRTAFSQEIKPEDVKNHDDIVVELEPDLPSDRQEQWLTAQIATTPGADGVPLASTQTAREDILKMQDADLENQRVFSQAARMSSPKTILMTQLVAAGRSGDEGTVQFLTGELQRLLTDEAYQDAAKRMAFEQMVQQNALQAAAQGINGQAQGGAPQGGAPQNGAQNPLAGIPPEFAGLSGVAPGSVSPSPDAGANTTGPRNTEARANAIGLTLAQR